MKNSTYRRLRKHLAYLYLFMTALVMGIIGILIFLLDHYAQVFSNQGTLRDSDFLLFYLKHELEFNLFLLAAGTALLLYLFVLLFFQNLDVLLDTVQGKPWTDCRSATVICRKWIWPEDGFRICWRKSSIPVSCRFRRRSIKTSC